MQNRPQTLGRGFASNMADNPCVLVKRFNSNSSCCGIVLDSDNGIVLTLASLFTDFLPEIEMQRPLSIHCPGTAVLSQDYFAATSQNGQITVEVVIRRNGQEAFRTLQGRVILFWRDEGIQRIAERIFPSSEWKFESLNYDSSEQKPTQLTVERIHGTDQPQQNGIFAHRSALSDFVLIQVKNLNNYLACKPLNLSTWRYSENPKKGDAVFVVGTPFGCECPPVFYNSVSKGIVSNLIGANNELIITDARCIPGCEGCTMYLTNSQSASVESGLIPHGIILAPFCWRNGEWVGIAVACSLEYLLDNLRKLLITKFPVMPQNFQVLSVAYTGNPQANLQYQPGIEAEKEKQDQSSSAVLFNQGILNACDVVQDALAGVVMVQCGMTWGSGIVLDANEGLIATCSHVIHGYQDSLKFVGNKKSIQYPKSMTEDQVSCMLPNGISHNVQVLYATRKGFPLDFALLKIQPSPLLRSLKSRTVAGATNSLSNPLYKKGEGIFVIGFPLFASHQHTKPSIVSGVLSNIAYASNHAVLLQSSAAVHCGASGGALVSMETGELLGMVTSHTKDVDMSSAFPHVNFSIPAELLCKLVLSVKSSVIEDDLQTLVSDRTESIWKLKGINESPQITSKL